MEIKLYYNASDNNVINKRLSEELSLEVLLKNETNVYEPVPILSKNSDFDKNPAYYNYAYIPAPFSRYYYITDRQNQTSHNWALNLRCDVLMSFKGDILNLSGIVERSSEFYNTYMSDPQYLVLNRRRVQTKAFPNGFTSQNLLLTVAGGGSAIQS